MVHRVEDRPQLAILNRDLGTVHEVDVHDSGQIQEYVAHSWYDYSTGKDSGLHPYEGETELNYTGPEPPYEQLDVENGYSWLKSPRWKGNAMEVGPLARMLMLYATGHDQAKELVDYTLKTLDVPVGALFSKVEKSEFAWPTTPTRCSRSRYSLARQSRL